MSKESRKGLEEITTVDGGTWYRILDQAAADRETKLGEHAVRYFFGPGTKAGMAFYTLRSPDGGFLATAMLPLEPKTPLFDRNLPAGGPQVVGFMNGDPFPAHADAIAALGRHLGRELGPELYAYRRSSEDGPGERVEEPRP